MGGAVTRWRRTVLPAPTIRPQPPSPATGSTSAPACSTPSAAPAAPGGASADSGHELFLIPEFGYNRRLDDRTAIGLTVYGNAAA